MIRKSKTLLLLLITVAFCSCGAESSKPDRNFYYQNTKWGMTVEEVIKAKGEPDERSDEMEEAKKPGFEYKVDFKSEQDEASSDNSDGGEASSEKLLDFYYYDRTFLDKYTASERVLFDADNKLEAVTARVYIGAVEDDLTNLDEVVQNAEETYLDIKDILTKDFGEPNAEYTAYMEEGEYKTKEELDLKGENSFICTSRWDGEQIGDNVRFIYIVYYLDELRIDIRYTYHSKETIDRVNAGGKP